jgi:myo-inositol-1(or 4)-monophosphatase
MMPEPLTDYLDAAKEAARRGAAVLEEWRHRFQVREKARADLVTEADLGSQQAIREYLADRFPGHGFLGEEDRSPQDRPGPDAPPTWIVDPLDGTTNYVHDCPLYCVSVGLQVAGELVVGVVLDPCRDELFAAAKGHGAWVNDRRLQTSRATRLDEALLATGFPPDLAGQERLLEWWRYFSLRTRSLRRTGTTALNMAYVAAGRFDGYWAFDNHVWDVAGATVLVREAGGVVTNTDGTPYDPYTPDALVSNGPLHPVLLECFRTGPAGV